jgi:hypothetical protein
VRLFFIRVEPVRIEYEDFGDSVAFWMLGRDWVGDEIWGKFVSLSEGLGA